MWMHMNICVQVFGGGGSTAAYFWIYLMVICITAISVGLITWLICICIIPSPLLFKFFFVSIDLPASLSLPADIVIVKIVWSYFQIIPLLICLFCREGCTPCPQYVQIISFQPLLEKNIMRWDTMRHLDLSLLHFFFLMI